MTLLSFAVTIDFPIRELGDRVGYRTDYSGIKGRASAYRQGHCRAWRRRRFPARAWLTGWTPRTAAHERRGAEAHFRSSKTALGRTTKESKILVAKKTTRKSTKKKSTASRSGGGGKIVRLAVLEKEAIQNALNVLKDDKLKAARMLGIGKTTLYRKLKEYGW